MKTLEQRVQRAHSKLPAPTSTPPRASPRSASVAGAAGGGDIPSSVTVRSSRKRASQSVSTAGGSGDGTNVSASRLSFGFNPSASVSGAESRPSSRASMSGAGGGAAGIPRPSSRTSIARPPSQTGMRTPSSLGYYPQSERRPRSSMSGSYAQNTPSLTHSRSDIGGSRAGTPSQRHRPSSSMAFHSQAGGGADDSLLEGDEDTDLDGGVTPTARRTTLDAKGMGSAIPAPGMWRRQSHASLVRRQSGISVSSASAGDGGGGEMRPPSSIARRPRMSGVDVGETF